MSLILEGIDMPKENEYWTLTIWGDGSVYGRTVETSEARAIQIPKDHGRIVDINNVEVEEDVYYQCYRVDAPTILEAENSDG